MKRRTFLKISGLSALSLAVGGIAYRIGGVWWDQEVAPGYAVLSRDEVTIVDAIGGTMFPGDPRLGIPSGGDVEVSRAFDAHLDALDTRTCNMLRLLLHAIDDVAFLSGGRFRSRSHADRIWILNEWDQSSLALRRGAFRGLKLLLSCMYFEHPQVLATMGFHFSCGGVS